jgi:hypothetical protein
MLVFIPFPSLLPQWLTHTLSLSLSLFQFLDPSPFMKVSLITPSLVEQGDPYPFYHKSVQIFRSHHDNVWLAFKIVGALSLAFVLTSGVLKKRSALRETRVWV